MKEVEEDMKARKSKKKKNLLLHEVGKEKEKEEECVERKLVEAGKVMLQLFIYCLKIYFFGLCSSVSFL